MNKVPSLRFKEFSGEWEEKKLNEIINYISSGKTLVKSETGKYNLYGSTGKIGFTKKADYKGENILIARVGANAGTLNFINEECGITDNTLVTSVKNNNSNKWLYYYLIYYNLNRLIFGSGQPLITGSLLKNLKINLPYFAEQEKIGNFLSSVDKKISIAEEKLNLFNQYKKGIMQKIFKQELRFKDENGNNYPNWEEKTLNSIFERITEKNKENNENVLTISAQYGLISQTDFFNKSVAGKDLTKYYLLHKDDFAYNKSYSNGYPMGAIKRLTKYDKGIVSTLYICFRVKNNDNVSFLEQFFESKKIEKSIQDIAQEGARNHGLLNISVGDFFDITINVPCLEEQKKIADFLSAIDNKIENISDNLESLKLFKKSMLQKMFV